MVGVIYKYIIIYIVRSCKSRVVCLAHPFPLRLHAPFPFRQADQDEEDRANEQFRIGFERGFENALKMAQRRESETLLKEAKELSSATPLIAGQETPANKKRIVDWVKDQEQFAHLPKLPANWIRVKQTSGPRRAL